MIGTSERPGGDPGARCTCVKPQSRGPLPAMLEAGDFRGVCAAGHLVVEPAFGQIKEARGCRRFHLRGRVKVSDEWHLVCAVHNLGKLFRRGQAGRVIAGWSGSGGPASGRKALGWI